MANAKVLTTFEIDGNYLSMAKKIQTATKGIARAKKEEQKESNKKKSKATPPIKNEALKKMFPNASDAAENLGKIFPRITKGIESFTDQVMVSGKALVSFASNPVGLAIIGIVGIGAALAAVTAAWLAFAASVTGASLAVIGFAIPAAIRFQKLEAGIRAVVDTSEDFEKTMIRLKQAAKLPGATLDSVTESFTQLVGSGLEAELAARTIEEFGNALALVGRGEEDLKGVNTQLAQMISSNKFQGDEFKIMAERMPQLRRAMIKAFGTTEAEELEKKGIDVKMALAGIIKEMENLGRAEMLFTHLADKFRDLKNQLLAMIGKPILERFTQIGEIVMSRIQNLLNTDFFTKAGEGFASLFSFNIADKVVEVVASIVAVVKNLPEMMRHVTTVAQNIFTYIGALIGQFRELFNGIVGIFNQVTNGFAIFMNSIISTLGTILGPLGLFLPKMKMNNIEGIKDPGSVFEGIPFAEFVDKIARDKQSILDDLNSSEKKGKDSPQSLEDVKLSGEAADAVKDQGEKQVAAINGVRDELITMNEKVQQMVEGSSIFGKEAFNQVNLNKLSGVSGRRAASRAIDAFENLSVIGKGSRAINYG